ncbi:MAG: copper resistance protein NlpE N-terminal domain-containing protein [Mesonia sp.]|uniref:copper resistance protein NlpE N-terminal domain-containing protein n=1 Tax=Mesonia sp. TaxID=1960830 RepID=UPI00324201AD
MKIKILGSILVLLSLLSCNHTSLDYVGVYEGKLPCDGCDEVETKLTLKEDEAYMLYEIYKSSNGNEIKRITGNFEWTDTQDVLVIQQVEALPIYFKIEENRVIQLDPQEKSYSNEQDYILTKIEE